MKHLASAAFWKAYGTLPEDIRAAADRQFRLLDSNPNHPSVQFKRVKQERGQEWYSARVTLNYRAVAIKRPHGYTWIWIGDHKTYDKLV